MRVARPERAALGAPRSRDIERLHVARRSRAKLASLLSPAMRGEIVAPVTAGLGGTTLQGYFGLGTLVYPPWIVQRAAYWGMYTTTAYDPTTGISLAVTISLSPASPPKVQPSNEIIAEISKLLTPDHPVPR
jgi:hypothetical protein